MTNNGLGKHFILLGPDGMSAFVKVKNTFPSKFAFSICAALRHPSREIIIWSTNLPVLLHLQTFWWCNGCYNMALALIKLSLLFQYLRLLNENPDTKQPKTRIAIVSLIGVTSVWGVVYSILAWVPCIPVEGHWNFDESAIRYGYGSDEIGPFVATCMYTMSMPDIQLLLSQCPLGFCPATDG